MLCDFGSKRFTALLVSGFVLALIYVVCYTAQLKEVSRLNSPITTIQADSHNSSQDFSPFEEVWLNLSQLQCNKLFDGDKTYTNQYVRHKRITLSDPDNLDMSCDGIKSRSNKETKSSPETDFPLAFSRTVFTSYLFLEHMLSVEYRPQNLYCYSIDSKSSKIFKNRIRNLAKCFSNVIVVGKEYSVYSNGKNVTRAALSCLEVLHKHRQHQWKYVFTLQNHDIPLKTNWEMVEILKLYNGANDISVKRIMPISVNKKLNWTMASLKLYRNDTKNRDNYYNANGTLKALYHTKSLNLVVLARRSVQFVLEELRLDTFIDRLEKSKYGMDEVFFSTLNTNLLDFPGGFTTECLKKGRQINSLGRYTLWQFDGRCMSRKFRHDICIFGVEDLRHLNSGLFQFYFNKMMTHFDYGAIFCWLENLRKNSTTHRRINSRFYKRLPYVRYNDLISKGKVKSPNGFDCL
ncbi:core-2/I-Branching enzyme domain-containing protein [Ditylenchus destructor]|uniref:Core-2/I-Branching enzyme domain-containing protein n=1 Tax=Ditylenchus destructor TaxID=166010 RepID=A0AAD4NFC5_9BILA|nr:core-2/I-Branching enzyme domain-containing protein [Ditylenchus destructor]